MLSERKTISILILNYNGRSLIDECLSSIIEATRNDKFDSRVVVIDNNSTDESVGYIKKNFPTVNIIELKENRYLFSYNEVIKDCHSDYVVLLNNDVAVTKNFIEPLIEKMKDENVFSVMPNIRDWNGSKYNVGSNKNRIYFKNGWIDWEKVADEKEGVTFFTCAGAAIYDREKFVQLYGFDDIYYPAYVEDVDLCYRAWKHGWISYYEPRSVVYHKNSYTINQYMSKQAVWILKIRNKYLFFWKNIQDERMLRCHFFNIPLVIIKAVFNYQLNILYALSQALLKLNILINKRRDSREKAKDVLNDTEIIKYFGYLRVE